MDAYFGSIVGILVTSHLAFFIAVYFKRNDVADTAWGLGFVAAAAGAFVFKNQDPSFVLGLHEKLILICVGIWAFRLAYHISRRSLSHSEEDGRYKKMRQGWGSSWIIQSYLKVFLLQGLLLFVIVLPVIYAIDNSPQDFVLRSGIGFAIWLFGFIFESVGDHQLKSFTRNPANKGRIMDQGLWSWSRHPNYFGEVVQWWGIFIMACFSFDGVWLVISPALMTFLILKVSGVSLLEDVMKSRPGFAEYQKKTSIFFPWPPKN